MKNKRIIVWVSVTFFLILIVSSIFLENKNMILSKISKKQDYTIVEFKEKIEQQIDNLRKEQENKGETLKITDLPKINNEEIDVRSVQQFPVKVLCNGHKFEIDSDFNVNYIEDTDETIVTYTTNPIGYTNQEKVKILINIKNEKGIKTIEYPDDNDKLLANGKTEVGIDYKVTKNGTYTFKIVDNDNNEIEKDVVIDKIDTVEPKEIDINYKVGANIFRIKMNTEDGDKTDNSTKSGIDRYEIFLNDEKIGETSENEYIITNLTSNTKYSMYVVAYDKANNLKQSEIISFTTTLGEYPTITENSINFQDEDMLAIDAISPETFDNDYGTFGEYNKVYNYYNAKAYVDKSAWGKILKINFNIWYTGSTGYHRTLVMYCYDENEKIIGYITSTNCETATTYEYDFEIPEGCKSIKFVNDLTFRIYEIKIEDNKEINENDKTYRNLMPTVSTATTIKNGVIISTSDSYGNEYGAIMDNSCWSTASGNYGEHWFMVQFSTPKIIDKYEFKGMNSWGNVPSFYLQASNDKENWVNLEKELHPGVFGYTPQNYSIQVDNSTAYKYYRIYIPEGSGWSYGSSGATYIGNLKMYGY